MAKGTEGTSCAECSPNVAAQKQGCAAARAGVDRGDTGSGPSEGLIHPKKFIPLLGIKNQWLLEVAKPWHHVLAGKSSL